MIHEVELTQHQNGGWWITSRDFAEGLDFVECLDVGISTMLNQFKPKPKKARFSDTRFGGRPGDNRIRAVLTKHRLDTDGAVEYKIDINRERYFGIIGPDLLRFFDKMPREIYIELTA